MVEEVVVFGVTVVDETYHNKNKTKKTKQNKKRESYRVIDLSRDGDVIEAAYFDFIGILLKLRFVTFAKATGLGAVLQCDVVQRRT